MKLIVDLDDTLCNINHRRKYYGVDWDTYNRLMCDDEVIEPTESIIDSLYYWNVCDIIILTGRYKRYEDEIRKWLDRFNWEYELICKDDNDDRSSVKYKSEWIRNNCDSNDIIIDDRPEIAELASELNITYIRPIVVKL